MMILSRRRAPTAKISQISEEIEGFGAPVHFDASSAAREIKERLKD